MSIQVNSETPGELAIFGLELGSVTLTDTGSSTGRVWSIVVWPSELDDAPSVTNPADAVASVTIAQDGFYVVRLTRSNERPLHVAIGFPDPSDVTLPSPGLGEEEFGGNLLGVAGWAGRGLIALTNAALRKGLTASRILYDGLTFDSAATSIVNAIASIVGTGSEVGAPIVYSGQSVVGGVLEGTKGGATLVRGTWGGEGGDTYLLGGDAEVATSHGGNVYIEGGYFSLPPNSTPVTPTGGSTGSNVTINAKNAVSGNGKIALQNSGVDRIVAGADNTEIGAGHALHVLHDVRSGGDHQWFIDGTPVATLDGTGLEVFYPAGSVTLFKARFDSGSIDINDGEIMSWGAGVDTSITSSLGVNLFAAGAVELSADSNTKLFHLDAHGFYGDENSDTHNLSADVSGVTCTASDYTLVPNLAAISLTTKASGKIDAEFAVSGIPVTTACQLAIFVDGVITSPPIQAKLGLGLGVISVPMRGRIAGLSAGAHTIDLRYKNGAAGQLFIRPSGASGAEGEQIGISAKVVSG